MNEAITRAIITIRNHYSEPLTLESMAAESFFSPFHFSRLFRKHTGMPPGQYLTAVRLFEAKRLLMTTSLTVANIVTTVGYSSVGTFTTRFTKATGMSPSQFRDPEVSGLTAAVGPGFCRLPSYEVARMARRALQPHLHPVDATKGSIACVLGIPAEEARVDVLIGVFDSLVPQGPPVACHAVAATGSTEVRVPDVPAGNWHVIALATRCAGQPEPGSMLMGTTRRPVRITPGHTTAVDLRMRRPQPTDLPIALIVAVPSSLRRLRQA